MNEETDKKPERNIPEMSQVEFEDRLRILIGVPPQREKIVICED